MPEHSAMPELIIDSNQTIEKLKKHFNGIFPFLQLEFYLISEEGRQSKVIKEDLKLTQLQRKRAEGSIMFDNDTVVNELEEIFRNHFGLYVQVLRKSGNIWLETNATDNWTLMQQNEEGKNLALHLKK